MSDRPDVPPDLEVDIPVPQGLRVTTEQPYHILVVSDLAGTDSGAVSGPMAEGVVSVTADTFDEVMAAACPTVEFTLADPLTPGSVMVALRLPFDSLPAFDPKRLVKQIPATQALTDVRENLVARLRGKLSSDALTESVAKAAAESAALAWLVDALRWTAAPLPDDPGAVDDLLGQIDFGDEPADPAPASPPPKTGIGAVVAAAADTGSAVPSEEAAAVRRAVTEIDRRVSRRRCL